MDVLLTVVKGPRTGLRFRASGRTSFTIGRSKTNDFPILDSTMSRVHALLAEEDGAWYVEDQKSRNGLWVNGKRVERFDLEDGLVFELGRVTAIQFSLSSPEEAESGQIEVKLVCAGCRNAIASEADVVKGADGRRYHLDCRNLDHLVGTDLGDFRVVEAMQPLGGAFFFRAHQATLNRTVVLEVFDTPLITRRGFKQALLEEVRRASRYLHPNILQIFDFGEARGTCFVVMEHFRGEPLTEILTKRRFVKIRGAVTIAMKLLEALQYAQEQGTTLPYLTPDGVLVSADYEVKVKLFKEPELQEDTAPRAKDAAYVSPETLRGGEPAAHETACVYSVGAILYHMLAGIPPFEGATTGEVTRRALNEQPPSLRRINLKVSPGLSKVVEAAITRSPEERPQTFPELLDQLRRLSRR